MDEDQGQGGQGGEGDGAPDPRDEQIKALNAQLEAARKDAEDVRGLASALVSRYTSNEHDRAPSGPAPRQAVPAEEEEPDFDNMSPREMAKYFRTQQQRAMAEMTSNMARVFQQRVQQDDARWGASERERTAAELSRAGMSNIVPEVDKYLRDSGITPDIIAQPGVYRRAAAQVLGEQLLNEKLAAAQRAPALASAGGGSYSARSVSGSSITNEELEWLAKRGVKMDAETWKRVSGNDSPLIDLAAERLGGGRP